jgi:hypothetical protein
MLLRVEQNGTFHIDGTYKIVKHNFPLIVLGITDIERKFHQIAYMFTSHEQKQDCFCLLQNVVPLGLNLSQKSFVVTRHRQ